MSKSHFKIYQLSEQAATVQFEEDISLDVLDKVLSFRDALLDNFFAGLIETVPTYCALTVYYDPVKVIRSELPGESAFEKVSGFLNGLNLKRTQKVKNNKVHLIPVCYDLKCGLDLPWLSKHLKLSIEEIVKLHEQVEYTVFMIGFTPGFPYMGSLDQMLECPRKKKPRLKLPAGSVGIAGKQTGIYPFETPGGWQIVGRTPMKLFSTEGKTPILFQAGDKVKFEAITLDEFNQLI